MQFGAGITIRGSVHRHGMPGGGGARYFDQRDRTRPRSPFAMVGPDGTYEVNGVEPGDYDVRVSSMGGGNDNVPYTVTGNAVFDIDLKGAPLRGVVLDSATGAPLPDARVSAMSAAAPGSAGTQGPRVWRRAV